jgi:hypothetical protein
MSTPATPRRWLARVRPVIALLLAVSGSTYALFGDQLVNRVAVLFDRAGRRVGETSEDIRIRTETERLDRSRKTFEELVACRESLAQQVKALGEHRAAVASRLNQDSDLLRRVLAARSKGEGNRAAGREVVDRDAADVLSRVQSSETELAKCDAELRRLAEALDGLDRSVDRSRLVLQQQADELERRRVGAATGRAHREGLDLANQITSTR